MPLLFDNNLSVTVCEELIEIFPRSSHVFQLGIDHLTDRQIWQYAKEHKFTIVSKDKDFYHLANTLGAPPKFIWLTIGNCKNSEIIALLLIK